MARLLRNLSALLVVKLLLGCSVMDPFVLSHDHYEFQKQRVRTAEHALRSLAEVDVFIRLDNSLLAQQIQAEMVAQAALSERIRVNKVRVQFARQYIALEANATVTDDQGRNIEANFHGEVILTFTGSQLIWLPQFNQVALSRSVFGPGEVEPDGDEEVVKAHLLAQVTDELSRSLVQRGRHIIEVDSMPLGILEVGASLTNLSGVVANGSHDLGGVFTIAGSAILIDSSVTSIALDLNFVPSVSICPGHISVSRATFAREIRSREPVGVSRILNLDEDAQYFFTEISGATRPTSVIHYWFADGQPVSVVELNIEPSATWRTWSKKEDGLGPATNWEVIVVEKESGCILGSLAIRTEPVVEAAANENEESARQAFNRYRRSYRSRVADFSIARKRPDIALVEVPRPFLGDVLKQSLRDLHISSDLELAAGHNRQFSGFLGEFDANSIQCEQRQCSSSLECSVDYEKCPLERDTRSCISCQFRNPLNNRCISEGQDPICEATRAARNTRFDRTREACIESEQSARRACDRLRKQEIRSCELEAASEEKICESRKELVRTLQNRGPVAGVTGRAQTNGELSVFFSGFDLEGDLERIRMNLGLRADLVMSGSLAFEPEPSLEALGACVAAWRDTWSSRVFLPQWESSLISQVEEGKDALSANWSGFSRRVSLNPSPLQSMFVANPHMLADCQIGLSVNLVSGAISGRQSEFFNGYYDIAIQPLPTRIQFLPASLSFGEVVYTGEPVLNATHLVYEIRK